MSRNTTKQDLNSACVVGPRMRFSSILGYAKKVSTVGGDYVIQHAWMYPLLIMDPANAMTNGVGKIFGQMLMSIATLIVDAIFQRSVHRISQFLRKVNFVHAIEHSLTQAPHSVMRMKPYHFPAWSVP